MCRILERLNLLNLLMSSFIICLISLREMAHNKKLRDIESLAFCLISLREMAHNKIIMGRNNLNSDPFSYYYYSIIFETFPAPTVLPPSRIANFKPSSIAIGVMSLIFIVMWSPGITISVPAGSSTTPVTSVVLK